MSTLWDEAEADAEVISNLIKEIRRLTPMPLLQLKDDTVIRVESYEVVTAEELQDIIDKRQAKLTEAQALLPQAPAVPSEPETPVAPDTETPAQPETPVDTPAGQLASPAADSSIPEVAPSDPAPTAVDAPAPDVTQPPIVLQ
jgi:hypothetical protein